MDKLNHGRQWGWTPPWIHGQIDPTVTGHLMKTPVGLFTCYKVRLRRWWPAFTYLWRRLQPPMAACYVSSTIRPSLQDWSWTVSWSLFVFRLSEWKGLYCWQEQACNVSLCWCVCAHLLHNDCEICCIHQSFNDKAFWLNWLCCCWHRKSAYILIMYIWVLKNFILIFGLLHSTREHINECFL